MQKDFRVIAADLRGDINGESGIYLASCSLNVQQLFLRQAEYAYAISMLKFAGLDSIIRQTQAVYAAQCSFFWRTLCSIKSL